MAISRNQARELTTQDEQALVDASFHPAIRSLSEARLRQKVSRARRLRDKYSDLLRRQGVRSKRRGRGGGDDNRRTERKEQLFGETLERFEARLQALTAPPPAEPESDAASATAKPAKPARSTKPAAAKPRKPPAPPRADKAVTSRGKVQHSHTRAAGARRQAKRDKR